MKDSFATTWRQASWFEKMMMLAALAVILLAALSWISGLLNAQPVEARTAASGWLHTRYCVKAETEVLRFPYPTAEVTHVLQAGQEVSLTLYNQPQALLVEFAGGSGFVLPQSVEKCGMTWSRP